MLIDLLLVGKRALIVGEGKEPEFKALKLLDAKATVTVVGERFTDGLRRTASKRRGKVSLISARPTPAAIRKKVEEIDPRVVFISTGNPELDEELSEAVRTIRGGAALICVVDEPRLNDFNMPAIAKKGDIRGGRVLRWLGPSGGGSRRSSLGRTSSR
jgi:siroheme synthase (precorrin-2 oxidase/ferrochelatase)